MPEGHTLHRLAALHTRRYVGRPVAVSSPQGRFATNAEMVDGRVLESAEAHGKHLFTTRDADGCCCRSQPRTILKVRI
jgi:endonuclease VIII